MINNVALQRLSVRDCFAEFAWQGRHAAPPVVREMAALKSSWQTTAVQDFFAQYNWSGRTNIAVPVVPLTVAADTSFAVTWPVKQFFDCFVWAGPAQIAPQPMVDMPALSPDRDFKLSNFADLF